MYDIAEKLAITFRQSNGLNNIEPILLESLLQKNKVLTIFLPLSPNFSGMAIKNKSGEDFDRFMMVNCNQSIGKQNFTICHELYHLFIQQDFTSQVCNVGIYNIKDPVEFQADLFASYLLIPTDGVKANLPDKELSSKQLSLDTIIFLEQYFKCSRRAILHRLLRMKLITPKCFEEFATGVINSACERGYPATLYKPANEGMVVGNYGQLAKTLFDGEKISESHYNSLLDDLGIGFSDDLNSLDEDA